MLFALVLQFWTLVACTHAFEPMPVVTYFVVDEPTIEQQQLIGDIQAEENRLPTSRRRSGKPFEQWKFSMIYNHHAQLAFGQPNKNGGGALDLNLGTGGGFSFGGEKHGVFGTVGGEMIAKWIVTRFLIGLNGQVGYYFQATDNNDQFIYVSGVFMRQFWSNTDQNFNRNGDVYSLELGKAVSRMPELGDALFIRVGTVRHADGYLPYFGVGARLLRVSR